jgi:hypothetical protein
MTTWLKRQEAVDQFSAYLDWLTNRDIDDGEETDAIDNEDEDDRTHRKGARKDPLTSARSFVLAEPGPFPSTHVDRIETDFHCTHFLDALALYLRGQAASCSTSNTISIPQPTISDRFNVYKCLSIPVISIPKAYNASARKFDRIRATPSMPGKRGRAPAPAHSIRCLCKCRMRLMIIHRGHISKVCNCSLEITAF